MIMIFHLEFINKEVFIFFYYQFTTLINFRCKKYDNNNNKLLQKIITKNKTNENNKNYQLSLSILLWGHHFFY